MAHYLRIVTTVTVLIALVAVRPTDGGLIDSDRLKHPALTVVTQSPGVGQRQHVH